MKYLPRVSALFLIVFASSLLLVTTAQAFPPLPSSFYGTVKINGENVADGTLIEAMINGQVFAQGYTQLYQGDSMYALDVQGDDSSTAVVDGGREGETVQFKISGVLADQIGIWHGGTNANLNLAATSSGPTAASPAKPAAPPTQTAIVSILQPRSPVSTVLQPVQATETPTILVAPSQTATQPPQPSASPSHTSTVIPPATVVSGKSIDPVPVNRGPEPSVILAIALVICCGSVMLALLKKRANR